MKRKSSDFSVDCLELDSVPHPHRETVQMLLARGADPTAKAAGWTPIGLAKDGGDTEMIKLLMDAVESWK